MNFIGGCYGDSKDSWLNPRSQKHEIHLLALSAKIQALDAQTTETDTAIGKTEPDIDILHQQYAFQNPHY